MPTINEMFPSTFIKAEDLKGRPCRVLIAGVIMEKMQEGDTKPVLTFTNTEKKLVLNKTNATTIASIHGDATEYWVGKEITLIPSQTDYAGKTIPCIRVQLHQSAPIPPAAPAPAPAPTPAAQPAPAPAQPAPTPADDDVPF